MGVRTQEDTDKLYRQIFKAHPPVKTIQEYLDKKENIVSLPESGKDVAVVQLKDMEEKIVNLKAKIESYRVNKDGKSRTDVIYRRLSEACVKYSIQLDRVNVIGREKLRNTRRGMLLELDQLSTDLVVEQSKNN